MKKLAWSLLLLPMLMGCLTVRSFAQTPAPSATPAPAPTTEAEPAPQKIDPAKEQEIRKMLELTGTVKNTQLMVHRLIGLYQERNPQLSADFWENLENGIKIQPFIDKMVPIYDQYYTLDDLKAINAFYSSPAGQHMVTVVPEVMAASIKAGQDWGGQVSIDIGTAVDKEKAKQNAASAAAATNAPAPATPPPAPAAH